VVAHLTPDETFRGSVGFGAGFWTALRVRVSPNELGDGNTKCEGLCSFPLPHP